MATHESLLEALGGEAGCRRLSADFYARVGKDPVLHPLFPGKSLKCAIEEFAAFLIQFLDGDEAQTQRRWWLSLHESHARFQIGPAERTAWLTHMRSTLDAAALDDQTRQALWQFFEASSAYVIGQADGQVKHAELYAYWADQLSLDEVIRAIASGRDQEVVTSAPRFAARPSVFVGLLVRMMQSGRDGLIDFVTSALTHDPSVVTHRFAGKTLLHFASGAGCLAVVTTLLQFGMDANVEDSGGHTPLYCVANECATGAGPPIVRALVQAGADVNASGGVTRATALHMAARRGHLEIASALLVCGAAIDALDRKGETPLVRAVNCRKHLVAQLLEERGASAPAPLAPRARARRPH